jgi:Holliday junction resolvase RusA-like endonuclease
MEFKFTIPGKPTGKGRPRFSRYGHTYTPEQTTNYENLVKVCFKQAYPRAEPFPPKIELCADIKAYYPIPASTSKNKKQKMKDGVYKPTIKPDADNVAKIILDSLNKMAFYDDAQIVVLRIEKLYSDEPHVDVMIGVLPF